MAKEGTNSKARGIQGTVQTIRMKGKRVKMNFLIKLVSEMKARVSLSVVNSDSSSLRCSALSCTP